MADNSKKIDVDKLLAYSDDLVHFLNNDKDIDFLKHCVHKSDCLRSRCRSDNTQVQISLEGYQKKIDTCKQKTEAAKAEVASDDEMHLLQKELDEMLQIEKSLEEQLRAITTRIKGLEEQGSLIEERKQVLKKLEQDDTKTQMELSMYASITRIIPDLNDPSKISGHIVDKEKKAAENFQLSSQEMGDFDTCNEIWKMVTR